MGIDFVERILVGDIASNTTKGTLGLSQPSLRDWVGRHVFVPNLERLGYCRTSLRENSVRENSLASRPTWKSLWHCRSSGAAGYEWPVRLEISGSQKSANLAAPGDGRTPTVCHLLIISPLFPHDS
jgi:hypothetical protein